MTILFNFMKAVTNKIYNMINKEHIANNGLHS